MLSRMRIQVGARCEGLAAYYTVILLYPQVDRLESRRQKQSRIFAQNSTFICHHSNEVMIYYDWKTSIPFGFMSRSLKYATKCVRKVSCWTTNSHKSVGLESRICVRMVKGRTMYCRQLVASGISKRQQELIKRQKRLAQPYLRARDYYISTIEMD